MAGSDDKPGSSRRSTSRAGSTKSGKSERGLDRIISGRHLDDASQYHGHKYHTGTEVLEDDDKGDDVSLDEGDLIEKESQDTTDLEQGSSEDIITEKRDVISNEQDLELGGSLEKPRTLKSVKSSKSIRDPNLVTWDGPDDRNNPQNWSMGRKWAATIVVSSFTFISPVSSSMVAPALNAIGRDLNITSDLELSLTLSIFILSFSVGPLLWGPLSEMYGRAIILQLSNVIYLLFNLGCGLAQTKTQMFIFRFLSGMGGSAAQAAGGGVLSDLFNADQRGKAISIYSLAPLLGPAVGPIAGGFVTENTTWRWVFFATCIADAAIQFVGLFYLQETYAPVLLGRKKSKLIKETGNELLHTEWDDPNRNIRQALKIALTRPFKLLFTQVIIQVLAIYMAFVYGLMYLVLATFPALWEKNYHESIGIGGLNYISLGVGFFIGTQLCAPGQDAIYRILKQRNNGVGRPEFRVPLLIPGAFFVPVGLFWYGWSAQSHTHWIMPNLGAGIFAAGMIAIFQCTQTYVVDAYTRYAASAIASITVLRSLAGFSFPLFAPYMYKTLDYGWGNSVLAFVAIGLGWPAPFLMWRYGEALRRRSTFAAG